jgi:hypothetical protein
VLQVVKDILDLKAVKVFKGLLVLKGLKDI